MSNMKVMDLEEFIEKYKPVRNPLRKDSSKNKYDTTFETYSPDLNFIDFFRKEIPKKIWTVIYTGGWVIVPGYHIVSGDTHIITLNEWEDENIQVHVY